VTQSGGGVRCWYDGLLGCNKLKITQAGSRLDSDSEDDQPAARKKPIGAKGMAGRGGKASGGKARAALLEDSEDDDSGPTPPLRAPCCCLAVSVYG